jgi:hypothetical protein
LGAEVGAQAHVGLNRRIDQHRSCAVLLRQPSRVESAERAPD